MVSVTYEYDEGEKDSNPPLVFGVANLNCARLCMKKLICVAIELKLASMCL